MNTQEIAKLRTPETNTAYKKSRKGPEVLCLVPLGLTEHTRPLRAIQTGASQFLVNADPRAAGKHYGGE